MKVRKKEETVEEKLGIPPNYQYKALYESFFLQSNWHANKFTALDHCLNLNKKISILDLGAGSGNFEIIFGKRAKRITAVDYRKEALDFLASVLSKKRIRNVKFVECDIRNLNDIKNIGKYDLILLVDVIEHIQIEEADKMIKNLKKLLVPGGKICVITPNYNSLWIYFESILDKFTIVPHFKGHQHLAQYYPENLKKVFEKNGYTTSSIQSFNLFSFAIPIRFLSTFLCRLELNSNIKFGNLLLGVFKNEKN
jgi:2-polyprenyl-3-methyl-5-hydroxy-6-metoxy-1,4-benzoquinol methylase